MNNATCFSWANKINDCHTFVVSRNVYHLGCESSSSSLIFTQQCYVNIVNIDYVIHNAIICRNKLTSMRGDYVPYYNRTLEVLSHEMCGVLIARHSEYRDTNYASLKFNAVPFVRRNVFHIQ